MRIFIDAHDGDGNVEVVPISNWNDNENVCVKWHVWVTCDRKIAEKQTCHVSLQLGSGLRTVSFKYGAVCLPPVPRYQLTT